VKLNRIFGDTKARRDFLVCETLRHSSQHLNFTGRQRLRQALGRPIRKKKALDIIRREMAPVDLVIYSLASPKRTDPRTGTVHSSALKPVGQVYSSLTIELDSEKEVGVTLNPATEKEVADTIAVMGGDDWQMWVEALAAENLLAPGAQTLAYSYIGPEVTWPIYRDGTIGQAKHHLELTARSLDAMLMQQLGGRAWISVNTAVVTQASSVIPVVPLYLSALSKVMHSKGLLEDPIAQMRRLFADFLLAGPAPVTDEEGRIRLDAHEMRDDVQTEMFSILSRVNTENLRQLTDFAGFKRGFRNLFGFEVIGVDYERPVEIDLRW
jgi:enoyl-[acyl-carrier protein] reductase/trans-2-enoyl-CoA reductase (NAD+)